MIYNGDISYSEPHFQYNGVRVVSPESIGLSPIINGTKVIRVILISPPSIDSVLYIPPVGQVITSTGLSLSSDSALAFSIEKDQYNSFSSADFIVLNDTSSYSEVGVVSNENVSTIYIESFGANGSTIDVGLTYN